jgi:hypothetical protein
VVSAMVAHPGGADMLPPRPAGSIYSARVLILHAGSQ